MGGGGSKQSSGPPPPPPPPPYVPPAKQVFTRGTPPANMKLSIAQSASCKTCAIGMDQGISSSTVILTRNIMGQIDVPPPKAPSSKWVWDQSVGIGDDAVPYQVETQDELNQRCSSKCGYLVANPANWGKKIDLGEVDAKGNWTAENGGQLTQMFNRDLEAWRSDQRIASKHTKNNGKQVYMWNPSDDPTDANSSQAVNYNNHGALTKLYLKPTLPFSVTFST